MRKVREEGGVAYQFEVVVVNIIAYDLSKSKDAHPHTNH